jgi:hypothetical protein
MLTKGFELPATYGENALCLLVQSPRVVFAYWELSEGHIRTVTEHGDLFLELNNLVLQDGSLVRGHLCSKIKLPPFTGNWYFHDLDPGCFYYCELGFEQDGMFYPLLRSNWVETPRAARVKLTAGWETTRITVPGISLTVWEEEPQTREAESAVSSMAFYTTEKNDLPAS